MASYNAPGLGAVGAYFGVKNELEQAPMRRFMTGLGALGQIQNMDAQRAQIGLAQQAAAQRQEQMQTQAQERQRMQAVIDTLPPQLRLAAMLDPKSVPRMIEAQTNPYTLGPGAVRMGPDGRPIASAPFKPDAVPFEAQGMTPDQFREYKRANAAAGRSQVNVDARPPSFIMHPSGEFMINKNNPRETVPITIAGTDQQVGQPQARARITDTANVVNIIKGKADEARDLMKNITATGLTGAASRRVPGTPAFNLDQTLDTIKSNIGFFALNAMREMSKTGGALGQVTVREIELLQNTIANLDLGQGRQTLERNLSQVVSNFERTKQRYEEAYRQRYGRAPEYVDLGQQATQTQTPAVSTPLPPSNVIDFRELPSGR